MIVLLLCFEEFEELQAWLCRVWEGLPEIEQGS
jgi:hypothetical protein